MFFLVSFVLSWSDLTKGMQTCCDCGGSDGPGPTPGPTPGPGPNHPPGPEIKLSEDAARGDFEAVKEALDKADESEWSNTTVSKVLVAIAGSKSVVHPENMLEVYEYVYAKFKDQFVWTPEDLGPVLAAAAAVSNAPSHVYDIFSTTFNRFKNKWTKALLHPVLLAAAPHADNLANWNMFDLAYLHFEGGWTTVEMKPVLVQLTGGKISQRVRNVYEAVMRDRRDFRGMSPWSKEDLKDLLLDAAGSEGVPGSDDLEPNPHWKIFELVFEESKRYQWTQEELQPVLLKAAQNEGKPKFVGKVFHLILGGQKWTESALARDIRASADSAGYADVVTAIDAVTVPTVLVQYRSASKAKSEEAEVSNDGLGVSMEDKLKYSWDNCKDVQNMQTCKSFPGADTMAASQDLSKGLASVCSPGSSKSARMKAFAESLSEAPDAFACVEYSQGGDKITLTFRKGKAKKRHFSFGPGMGPEDLTNGKGFMDQTDFVGTERNKIGGGFFGNNFGGIGK